MLTIISMAIAIAAAVVGYIQARSFVRGKLRFVLPTRLGHVELVRDVKNEDVLASLEA